MKMFAVMRKSFQPNYSGDGDFADEWMSVEFVTKSQKTADDFCAAKKAKRQGDWDNEFEVEEVEVRE